ncbi:MAG: hypothetical protein JNM07_05490 [Phycisphaerae bacterium]|nr:hypothetical protein [Phycisphaerae bacterium]
MRKILGALPALLVLTRCPAQLQLRGHGGDFPCSIERVDISGVLVRGLDPALPTQTTLVAWDVVRAVPGAPLTGEWQSVADAAWRARARLERGDPEGAEPLLVPLFNRLRGTDGPTASLVAEGLVRCRVARGALTSVVWPWLEWVRVRRAMGLESWRGGELESDGVPMLDRELLLCPGLPPMFEPSAAVDALTVSGEWDLVAATASNDQVTLSLAALYRHAAQIAAGVAGTGASFPDVTRGARGVELVRDVVAAQSGEVEIRRDAMVRLRARIESGRGEGTPITGWEEAWCRAALGRAMLREPDDATRRSGVVQLLHIPVRLSEACPSLAALALRHSADEVARQGNSKGAELLRAERRERFSAWVGIDEQESGPTPTGVRGTP